jgi:alpha-beta hydrolase superfamily lysophospholipase
MRRWIVIVVAVSTVVIVAGAYLIWQEVKPPSASAFYEAPSSVANSKPGRILRTEKIESQVPTARLWRILYASSDINGKTIAVSGLVAAPVATAPSGGYPVVVVAHGTSGINQGCAPSIKPFGKVDDKNTAYEYLVGQYVSAGYAVVMADFEGLGVKGNNSYLVGEVEGRNVLDSARALKAFPKFKVNPKMLVAGQSQGGHAALWAGQLQPSYAPDVDIIGVVGQAPATDLEAMFLGVTSPNARGGIVSLLVMAADAYTKQYPDVKIDDVLTSRGRGALGNVVKNLCLVPAIIGTQLAKPSDLIQPNGLDALKPDVEKNIPGSTFTMPIFLAQGDADVVVLPTITRAYAAKACAAGVDLTLKTYPGVGHFDVVDSSDHDVLTWMAAVRNGAYPPSTCT